MTTDLEAVRRSSESLAKSPVFHLSLHSKELFHSNFLAWLFEAYQSESAAAMLEAKWSRSQAHPHEWNGVRREKRSLDLVIQLSGIAPLVIENKVFSPPDDSQLERYAANLGEIHSPVLVLLSLAPPHWRGKTHQTGDHRWRYRSYRELADLIESIAAKINRSRNRYETDLIHDYVLFLRSLVDIAEATTRTGDDDPVRLEAGVRSCLDQIRFHDAIGKLRARTIQAHLRDRSKLPRLRPVSFESGFTRSSPLIEGFVPTTDQLALDTPRSEWTGDALGWQLQGDEFRLVVTTGDHHGARSKVRRHAYVKSTYEDWFEFEPVQRITGARPGNVPKLEAAGDFNSYNPDFVYRYRKVGDLTISELMQLSDEYLRRALEA